VRQQDSKLLGSEREVQKPGQKPPGGGEETACSVLVHVLVARSTSLKGTGKRRQFCGSSSFLSSIKMC
jgi:hypothetical protein